MPRLEGALAVLVLGGTILALAIPDAISGETIAGTVETVVDGDSLKLDGDRRVRLYGIDAPESDQRCSDGLVRGGGEYGCGTAAWGALIRMVQRDRRVSCEVKDHDRYGRTVAICSNSGGDLGRRMVASGWALAYRRYSTLYVDEEAAAKAERLGIWSGSFQEPEQWRREHPR